MNPQYSILVSNQNLTQYKKQIDSWLHSGIKVIWFGSAVDADTLKNAYPDFAKELLLQAYSVDFSYQNIIIDGKDKGLSGNR